MRAVLYCRVSTTEQAQNLSLATQEEACREYCGRQGYDVDRVFVDAGESAKTTDRPEFRKMLEHCRRGRGQLHAVVVYSLTRFSRNNADHHAIASLLRGLGIALRSVTEPIDDSPSGRLMEGILASMAQFDNDVRSERVTVGMKAAIDRGRWVWPAPLGFLNGARGGPSLVPDPARAAAVREAFECCARGIVGRALLQRVHELGLTTKHGRPVSQSRLYELLRQPVYAGIVHTDKWAKEQRGDFDALVSADTFGRVQARLNQAPHKAATEPHRNRNSRDDAFPLRRFIRCASCGCAVTGSLSRGRTGVHYPFYHCRNGCTRVAKAALEQRFVELLDQLRPHPAFWKVLESKVLAAWRTATKDAQAAAAAARRRLTELEDKRGRLDALFIDQAAIDQATYQRRRDELREQIAFETLNANAESEAAIDVEAMLAFAEHAMTHAGALWSAETSTSRRAALQWALFPTGLRLTKNGVFETPLTCLEFFGLAPREDEKKGMVDHPAPTWKQAGTWLTSLYALRAA